MVWHGTVWHGHVLSDFSVSTTPWYLLQLLSDKKLLKHHLCKSSLPNLFWLWQLPHELKQKTACLLSLFRSEKCWKIVWFAVGSPSLRQSVTAYVCILYPCILSQHLSAPPAFHTWCQSPISAQTQFLRQFCGSLQCTVAHRNTPGMCQLVAKVAVRALEVTRVSFKR